MRVAAALPPFSAADRHVYIEDSGDVSSNLSLFESTITASDNSFFCKFLKQTLRQPCGGVKVFIF